ncbi:putative DNA binding domain-containing protein [Candidatus Saganbacteria bacterium]|nr:putative DNA binding domain-containing protein [Candidatus Saganbacteria bacterium]
MNWDDILALLEQGEGQAVEFEKSVPAEDDIARELVAFSNADGGKIVYGLDDKNKHLVGADVGDDFSDWLARVGKSHCSPAISPQVDVFEKGNKKIIIITVAEGDDKPYRSDDICYIRDGIVSRPAEESEVKALTNPWSGKGLNKRQLRAMQMMAEHTDITNREYRDAFSVSHKTAHIELTLLADKGLALSQGAGRSTRYILAARPEL